MKNFLNTNYNIIVDKIYKTKGDLFFFTNNTKIYIVSIDENDLNNITEQVKVSNALARNQVTINTILLNKYGSYFSKYKEKTVILIIVNDNEKNKLYYSELLKLQNYNENYFILEKINLITEWESEIDILENELMEYNKENRIVQNSFNYYVGLAELALQFYKHNTINKNIKYCIGHYRLTDFNRKNFNNPLFLKKIDNSYDVANYIKHKLYFETIDFEEIYEICQNNTIDTECLISCLLYPTYYFNNLKAFLKSNDDRENDNIKKIKHIINKQKKLEDLFVFLRNQLKNEKIVEIFNWL